MSIEYSKVMNCLMLIAIVGDFAVPFFLAVFYRGYRHRLMVMSSLGNPKSPVRIPYNIWLVSLGVLLTGSCKTLYERYASASKSLSIAVVICVLLFAVGAGIIAGLFSVNENKSTVNTASKIHGIASALGFMALLFVPLLLAILSFREKNSGMGILSTLCFILACIFFVFFIMADKPRFKNTVLRNEGLWQRLSLTFMYIPLACAALGNLARAG